MGRRKARRVCSAPAPPPAGRATKEGFWFDYEEADRACAFFAKYLKHVKGKLAGSPLLLPEWAQAQIIRPLFGWKDAAGTRRYRKAYIEIPKKNAKSTMGAGIALYLLFCDKEQGAEIYSAAADREQAAIIFEIGAQMRDQSPALATRSLRFRRAITVPKTHSSWKVLSADAYTKHGLNAHGVIFDELHTQPNRELYDALKGATAARSQPLQIYFTTAGFDRTSICWEEHEYADQVLRGVLTDDAYLAVIYGADEQDVAKDRWTDPKVWHKANPSLGITIPLAFLKNECKEAQEKPALQNNFKRLHLNIWTSAETKWLPAGLWDKNAWPVEEEALAGRECFGGLDLASSVDLAAFARVFPPVSVGEPIKVALHFWIPGENIRARVLRDRVPYDLWTKGRDGLRPWIETTEGDVIDTTAIFSTIAALHEQTPIREIAFDRWGATAITTALADAGFTVIQFGQGYASMSAPTKELYRLLLGKQLAHGGNPVLRWMADNVMVVTDDAGNIKPSRKKSREKIDGIVATIMALDRHLRTPGSIYEQQGLKFL
jgi:phage terminase large subunit-like protein